MRILIACEFSGTVRRAFRARGHDAWSCDLLPAEDDDPHHLQADVNFVLNYPDRILGGQPRWMRAGEWDLLIAHPPCTYLTNAGARWLYGGKGTTRDPARWAAMEHAARFFEMLRTFRGIPKRAIENPIMHRHAREAADIPAPSQIVQPWQFGHGEVKATCLWLAGLPRLVPTEIVSGRIPRVHHESPGPERWKARSRTYQGLAEAMAEQWGGS
jgi:hypothetical protein